MSRRKIFYDINKIKKIGSGDVVSASSEDEVDSHGTFQSSNGDDITASSNSQENSATDNIGTYDGSNDNVNYSTMRSLEADYLSSGYFLSDEEQAEMNELLDANHLQISPHKSPLYIYISFLLVYTLCIKLFADYLVF